MPSRREFLLSVAGTAVGQVALSQPIFTTRPPAADGRLQIKLLDVPTKAVRPDGSWLLVWMEERDNRWQLMLWTPETPDEKAEAEEFLAAALRHSGGGDYDLKPTFGSKLANFFKGLVGLGETRRSAHEWKLIAAILAEPDADGPLFAYADWLTSQGNPQGEFIRVDVELDRGQQAGVPENDPQRKRTSDRWMELHDKHGPSFTAPLRRFGLQERFDGKVFAIMNMKRGVVTTVNVNRPGILPHQMTELFQAAPLINDLTLHFEHIPLAEIAAHPRFAQIVKVNASCTTGRITPDNLRRFAASPYLERLRELDLGYSAFGPAGARELAAAPVLSRLVELRLCACDILDEGLSALADADRFDRLEKLDLANNRLTAVGFAALGRCRSLTALRDLRLQDNAAAADGWGYLGRAAFARSLNALELGGWFTLDDPGVAEFAAGRFETLESLKIGSSELLPAHLAAFNNSPWFRRLKSLEFGYCRTTPDTIALLAKTPFAQLEKLDLTQIPLPDDVFEALRRSPAFSRVKKLELRRNELSESAVRAFVASDLSNLEELCLSDNALGPAALRPLLTANLPRLKTLNLSPDHLGAAKAEFDQRFGDVIHWY